MPCFWEHRYVASDPDYSTNQEFSSYLARLILRLQQGADFNEIKSEYFSEIV